MAVVRGPGFEYELIRRPGQKRINIRISQAGKVTVSAPRELSTVQIASGVAAKRNWVLKHLNRLQANREQHDPLQRLLLRGIPYMVVLKKGRRKRGGVEIKDKVLYVDTLDGSEESSLAVIEKWLIKLAKDEIEKRALEISRITDIGFKRVFFRNQRTRWGSSSGLGNISLNWRIIMIPPAVRDYLIIHELCHQRQLNHSPAYWRLVKHYFPEYRKAEAWLKTNRGIMGLFRE
ncbi:SprT family zinc-dependent metalloprotease [Marispirochaeta aestuarii]|uniref:M48 family metallopeptidase n=1 Tax=Marispirochaeta aestuarii TaxID=1963862 RepID=UPI0029C96721|nr:SprT family zinc-dependent metalloprotease [Marispirochaeta aestuarii]